MVGRVSQPLQKKPVDGLGALSGSERAELLRYAMLGAGVASFDWTISDDRVGWDGAVDILPYHRDPTRLARGASFLSWLNPESRARVVALLETRSAQQSGFELALEASGAMGSLWITIVGVRQARADGRTERLSGLARVTTEQQRDLPKLPYLRPHHQCTGHPTRRAFPPAPRTTSLTHGRTLLPAPPPRRQGNPSTSP